MENKDIQPSMEMVIQKLLQENASLTLAKMQLESMVEQYKSGDNK